MRVLIPVVVVSLTVGLAASEAMAREVSLLTGIALCGGKYTDKGGGTTGCTTCDGKTCTDVSCTGSTCTVTEVRPVPGTTISCARNAFTHKVTCFSAPLRRLQ
jgi:hypothetical protein